MPLKSSVQRSQISVINSSKAVVTLLRLFSLSVLTITRKVMNFRDIFWNGRWWDMKGSDSVGSICGNLLTFVNTAKVPSMYAKVYEVPILRANNISQVPKSARVVSFGGYALSQCQATRKWGMQTWGGFYGTCWILNLDFARSQTGFWPLQTKKNYFCGTKLA